MCVIGGRGQWVNPDQKTLSWEEGWVGLPSRALGEALFLPPYKRDGGSEGERGPYENSWGFQGTSLGCLEKVTGRTPGLRGSAG